MALTVVFIKGSIKFTVPCVANFGSCVYDDTCSFFPAPGNCPGKTACLIQLAICSNNKCRHLEYFVKNNIPCSCPFQQGSLYIPNYELAIASPVKIPASKFEF